MQFPLSVAIAGFGVGLSLIAAIGAQSAFVLRQGLLRSHVGTVVLICALSDVILVTSGVLGAGSLFAAAPWLLSVARYGGAAFLLVYAMLAARRALQPRVLERSDVRAASRMSVALAALALTWLNPHVYLDAFVLLGSIASQYGEDRWAFGLGATLSSAFWFCSLGFGARLLGPVFKKPIAWRVLDAFVAATMTVLGLSLLTG